MRSSPFAALAGVALTCACLPLRAQAPATASGRPNVILLITDQQQGDALSAFGNPGLRTPHLDSLAADGVAFRRAYAANPRCVPSRCAMFTGHFPHQTTEQENGGDPPPPFHYPLLGRYFADAGYETVYFGKYHMPVDDIAQHGFEQRKHLRSAGQDTAATEDAVAFLRRPHIRPFLMVVSYCDPHNICEYGRNQKLPDGSVGAPPSLAGCPPAVPNFALPRGEADSVVRMHDLRSTLPEYAVLNRYTSDDWRRYRWAYYRMIEKADADIGQVLAALRQSGDSPRTLVAFTSDHGECAGAHGFSEKIVFYEESVRVPFVLSWPGHLHRAETDALINTGVSLLPTLLDFAGIPAPATLPGRSVRPIATGHAVKDWPRYVISENEWLDPQNVATAGRMVRTATYKYCVYDRGVRKESLFDEVHDPLETQNLAYDPAHRSQLEEARRLLARHARQTGDAVAAACLRSNS